MNIKHKAAMAATMSMLTGLAWAGAPVAGAFQGRDASGAASATCTATGAGKCTYF